jgi:hypothetical protein
MVETDRPCRYCAGMTVNTVRMRGAADAIEALIHLTQIGQDPRAMEGPFDAPPADAPVARAPSLMPPRRLVDGPRVHDPREDYSTPVFKRPFRDDEEEDEAAQGWLANALPGDRLDDMLLVWRSLRAALRGGAGRVAHVAEVEARRLTQDGSQHFAAMKLSRIVRLFRQAHPGAWFSALVVDGAPVPTPQWVDVDVQDFPWFGTSIHVHASGHVRVREPLALVRDRVMAAETDGARSRGEATRRPDEATPTSPIPTTTPDRRFEVDGESLDDLLGSDADVGDCEGQKILHAIAREFGWVTDWATGSPITLQHVVDEIRRLRRCANPSPGK